jgi:hypothetical protein
MHGRTSFFQKKPADVILRKRSSVVSHFFRKLLQREENKKISVVQRKYSAPHFGVLIQILFHAGETFGTGSSSIRVQLDTGLFKVRFRKTPRWQPRGCDTQSFRPLVQEEEVSSRARVLVRRLCVNCIWPAPVRCIADSILSERKLTRMKTNSLFRSLALLAAIALAVPAFAKPFAKTISITHSAKIGKADLQAGEYRLQIDGTKATVQKGRQVVAESEGRWEERSAKSAYDSLLIGENGQVKEARFAGQTRVFVFSE